MTAFLSGCRALKQALRLRVHIVWLLHHMAPGKQQPVVMRRVNLYVTSVQMLQATAAGIYACLCKMPQTLYDSILCLICPRYCQKLEVVAFSMLLVSCRSLLSCAQLLLSRTSSSVQMAS